MPQPAVPAFPPAGFRRFWIGETVSAFGSYVTLLALQTIVVLTLQGTAQDVGWLNSARWLPYLLLGLVVGALVDRYRRRPVMAATDLLRALLINDAASMSFLPRLVPSHHLQRAHARLDGADAVAQTTGPLLAGVLIKLVGAPLAVLVDALTYLFSAAVVVSLRTPEPVPARNQVPRNLLKEIAEGWRWVYGASGLATLAIATHVWFAANAIVGTVLAPLALTALQLSPLQFGVTTALGGAGAVAGAVGSGPIGRLIGTGWAVIGAHLFGAAGVAVMCAAGFGTAGWASAAVLAVGQGFLRVWSHVEQQPRDELPADVDARHASSPHQHHHALGEPGGRCRGRASRRAPSGARRSTTSTLGGRGRLHARCGDPPRITLPHCRHHCPDIVVLYGW